MPISYKNRLHNSSTILQAQLPKLLFNNTAFPPSVLNILNVEKR